MLLEPAPPPPATPPPSSKPAPAPPARTSPARNTLGGTHASGAAGPPYHPDRVLLANHSPGLQITDLSTQMKTTPQVKIGTTPCKTWRAFLTACPDLFTCDTKPPTASVCLKTRFMPVKILHRGSIFALRAKLTWV